MTTGLELISQERKEQLEKHNRSIIADVQNNKNGELIQGAMAILEGEVDEMPDAWDTRWSEDVVEKPYAQRLAIAGALIAAEIDRINFTSEIK